MQKILRDLNFAKGPVRRSHSEPTHARPGNFFAFSHRSLVMSRKLVWLGAVCFVLVSESQPFLVAQVTTAAVSGTVKDESGAVIPGMSVSVRNQDTGMTRNIVTDDQGRY